MKRMIGRTIIAKQARTQGGGGFQTPLLPFVRNPPPPLCFLLVTPEVGLVDGRYPYPMALHDFRGWQKPSPL